MGGILACVAVGFYNYVLIITGFFYIYIYLHSTCSILTKNSVNLYIYIYIYILYNQESIVRKKFFLLWTPDVIY